MSGRGEIDIDGERFPLDPDTMVRVSAGTKRKLYPGDDGMRVLVVGGVPGSAQQGDAGRVTAAVKRGFFEECPVLGLASNH